MTDYTIERWLRGKVDYDVPSDAIQAILYDNRLSLGSPMHEVSEMQRDLCLADLLMWLSLSSTTTSGEYISDGGWQHQKANKNVIDRAGLVKRAQALYVKWHSNKADMASMSNINIKSIY